MTFTLRVGTFVTFDTTNPSTVNSDMASTAAVCTITGSSDRCDAAGLPITIPAGSLVDILLHITPLNTQLPSTEDAIITLVCR